MHSLSYFEVVHNKEHIISRFDFLFFFLQAAPVAPPMTDSVMMTAAIKEEGTPGLHLPLVCPLPFSGAEEVALTPGPVHARAQGHIPPIVVAQCLDQGLGRAQGPFPPIIVIAALDLGHGQDQGLDRMSVEGELLGGGGDR